jgi:hypothetical protein
VLGVRAQVRPLPDAARKFGVPIGTAHSWGQKGTLAVTRVSSRLIVAIADMERLAERRATMSRKESRVDPGRIRRPGMMELTADESNYLIDLKANAGMIVTEPSSVAA